MEKIKLPEIYDDGWQNSYEWKMCVAINSIIDKLEELDKKLSYVLDSNDSEIVYDQMNYFKNLKI